MDLYNEYKNMGMKFDKNLLKIIVCPKTHTKLVLDENKNEVYVARDLFGVRPLFIKEVTTSESVSFTSFIKIP